MSKEFDEWLSKAYPGYVRTKATVYQIEAWNAELRYAAAVVDTAKTHKSELSVDTACDVIRQIILTEEVQGE